MTASFSFLNTRQNEPFLLLILDRFDRNVEVLCDFFVVFKHRALLISAMAYPFRVNFLSDVYESTAAAIDEGGLTGTVKQVGFKLNYFQTAC